MSQTEAEKLADERKKRLVKYFTEAPNPRDQMVGGAFLVAAIGLAACGWAILQALAYRTTGEAVFAVAFLASAVGLDKFMQYRKQYKKSHPRPLDSEMDLLLGDEIVQAQATALEKLEITSDDLDLTGDEWDPLAELEARAPLRDPSGRRPLIVFSPEDDARAEIGRDGLWRFSDYRVMVICPTHFSLGIYLCTIDILSGAMRRANTYEYHYDDVVAILTTTVGEQGNPRLFPDGKFRFARMIRRELKVVASSGDSPTIPVILPGNDESNRAAVEWSEIENVIASVRRVLRDRKGNARLEHL